MVRKDLNHVSSLGKVMTILGEGMDDSIEFLIMNIPILFGGVELMMKKEERMPSVIVFLLENSGIGLIRGISGESDGFAGLEGTDVNVISDV